MINYKTILVSSRLITEIEGSFLEISNAQSPSLMLKNVYYSDGCWIVSAFAVKTFPATIVFGYPSIAEPENVSTVAFSFRLIGNGIICLI